MKRKIRMLVLALSALVSFASSYADEVRTTVDGVVYRIESTGNGNTASIVGVSDRTSPEINIKPSISFNGTMVNVTDVGVRAFAGCKAKTIKLPATIITIGKQAFADSEIESLEIPESVRKIGDRAFARSKISNLELPDYPLDENGNVDEIAFIANAICGTYTGYGKIDVCDAVEDYALNGLSLTLSRESTNNGSNFKIEFAIIPEWSIEEKTFFNSSFGKVNNLTFSQKDIEVAIDYSTGEKLYTLFLDDHIFGKSYRKITTDGKTLSFSAHETSYSSPQHRQEEETLWDLKADMCREGVGNPPYLKPYSVIDNIVYQIIDNEAKACRLALGTTEISIPATVNIDGKEYPVTQIYLPERNARDLSKVTINPNPSLRRFLLPEIQELYIEESPRAWAAKSFHTYSVVDITGNWPSTYPLRYAWRTDNGICYSQKVYFEGKYITELEFGPDTQSIGSAAFAGLKQLKSLKITGHPVISNDAFRLCKNVESADAPDLNYALKEGVFGFFDNYDFTPFIEGEELKYIVFPDEIGTLPTHTLRNNKIEYIYIPASSDVYLRNDALICYGLKAAYVDKSVPPMAEASFDYGKPWAETDEEAIIGWGLRPGNDSSFSYFIPMDVYEDYAKNPKNPWYKATSVIGDVEYPSPRFNVQGFDFGKDTLPFLVK